MSTPTGPPSRGRLALALTAAAAAAVPAAAPAPVIAKAGTRSDVAPDARSGRLPTAPTRPAAVPVVDSAVADRARVRRGPVIVQYAVRPVSYVAPPAAATDETFDETADVPTHFEQPVAEVELVKLSRDGAGSRLVVVADEPGLLRVSWSAGSSRGAAKQQLRAGRHEVRLATPRGATHVRVQATLLPSSGSESASTHGAFRLRT